MVPWPHEEGAATHRGEPQARRCRHRVARCAHPGEQCQPDARRDHQGQAKAHRAQQVGPRGCGEHEALARVFPRTGHPGSRD